MSTSSRSTWRSIIGTVAAVAVASAPILIGVTSGQASASTSDRSQEKALKDGSTLSIRVNDRRVEAGETSKVRGNLNIKSRDDEPGKIVTLEARADGATGFTAIGTATAGANGGLKVEVTPAVSTRYRWSYAGDDDTRGSRSGVARILVGPDPGNGQPSRLQTTLSIRATQRPADGSGQSLVRGKLVARGGIQLPNREVILMARTLNSPFAAVALARTDLDGVVRFPVNPPVGTAYRLRFEGTYLLRPSLSGVVRIGVRPVITASATPDHVDPGGSTVVQGLVTYEGAPYVGATVDLLARSKAPHARFSVVASATTDALGVVAFPQTLTRTTVFRLVVRHSGGTPPRAVSDSVRVQVTLPSSLSIRGRTTPDGFAVSGTLRGGGGPIAGGQVALEVLGTDGITWTAVDSAVTRRHGKVLFVKPVAVGTSYRLSFAGSDRFAPGVSGVVVN